ncbi:MAG: phosphopantetheine-binding protein [Desulfuromonadales bacterium]|nr:phosphopantetheine-binding protein [Desulfuromonadales bacterium]
MTDAELKQLLFDGLYLIAPEADFSELRPDENIREELDIDSFDFLNFLIGINEKLGIEIPEQDYEKLMTLEQIVSYLMKRIQG